MAVLTAVELAGLRAAFQAKLALAGVTKPQLSAAFQQIEDWFEANRSSCAAAITGGFSASEKKALVAFWLLQKYGREKA